MPKLKSHSGSSKRFKLKSNGKVKFRHAFRNHILTKYGTKSKRQKRVDECILAAADTPAIKRLLHGS